MRHAGRPLRAAARFHPRERPASRRPVRPGPRRRRQRRAARDRPRVRLGERGNRRDRNLALRRVHGRRTRQRRRRRRRNFFRLRSPRPRPAHARRLQEDMLMPAKRPLKTASAVGTQFVELSAGSRFSYLRGLTPETLVFYIEAFEAGDFADLSRVMRAMERRDDIWTVSAAKARKDVSRRKWECVPLEGFEDDPDASSQADALKAFYASLRVCDYDCRNVSSGVRGLMAGLMRAYNDAFAVFEPVFEPRPDGTLSAALTRCPLDWFALRGGQMVLAADGRPLAPGEWIVCRSDGVGIACAVMKMVKVIALGDWLVYSGRCGHPGIHGKTSAQKGTQQWSEFVAALRKFGKEWAAATGLDDVIEKIDLSVAGTLPYPGLVDYANRAIASLQRGADLSTLSAGQGSGDGASLQGDESELIAADNCATVTECLRAQLDPVVIRWRFGDSAAVKAGFRVVPPQRDTLDRDLKIDAQLSAQGVRLSRRDALARYERREADPADPDDAPLAP
ncbi:MAG: DUF935 family protein, partial [Opitutae bacterium]|nr:DUF935 family protein [Opitutae bacterium]